MTGVKRHDTLVKTELTRNRVVLLTMQYNISVASDEIERKSANLPVLAEM
jgi:hypothetical protein